MKKRVLALVSAALLVASMSMTALAAPSKEVGGYVTGVEKAVDKDGKELPEGAKIVVEELPADKYVDEVKYIKDEANAKKELGSAYVEGMKLVDIKNVVVKGDPALINWDATVTFTADKIKAGQEVVLLHYSETKGAWEVIKATAGDGTITATFSSLSPVAYFVKEAAASTSPSTGEVSMMMWAVAAVVIGAAGIVASKKRA